MVEVAGIEPASGGSEPGLLRAQSAALFSAPAITQTSRGRAQSPGSPRSAGDARYEQWLS